MNYKVHLSTVFETEDLAIAFMQGIMKQLNDITFNGANKIDGVSFWGGSIVVKTQKIKECEQCSYFISPCRVTGATLSY